MRECADKPEAEGMVELSLNVLSVGFVVVVAIMVIVSIAKWLTS